MSTTLTVSPGLSASLNQSQSQSQSQSASTSAVLFTPDPSPTAGAPGTLPSGSTFSDNGASAVRVGGSLGTMGVSVVVAVMVGAMGGGMLGWGL